MKYILELEDEPNKEYFGEGNYYRCKQIPYWSISESMRNRLEPYDEADRKTEPSNSEKPNKCEHITEDGVTCAKYPACDDCLDSPLNKVKGSERLVKSSEQTEPTISKMEQVEQRSCDTCKGRDVEGWKNPCLGCTEFTFYEPKDEPQDEYAKEYEELGLRKLKELRKDEPQTNADQHVQHVGSVEPMQTEREGE